MSYSNAHIQQIMHENRTVLELLSAYLNYQPRFLDAETVQSFAKECDLSDEEAFLALFCAACGLDSADNRAHRKLEQLYFHTGIRCLDPDLYRSDPYYRQISFPTVKKGAWEMKMGEYHPFEPFVRTHPTVSAELREIPQLGYFKERFTFPSVTENGVEWMTVTPNEIETMKEPIEKSHGNVLTLGLGLGYFAFCASEKENVTSVTVVEKDDNVISLFTDYILPQFSQKEKIRIVKDDAFAYLKNTDLKAHFNYLFADLWHDASDGLEMYVRIKQILSSKPSPMTDYWIESSLLSALRHIVYDKLTESAQALHGVALETCLGDEFLKKLNPELR